MGVSIRFHIQINMNLLLRFKISIYHYTGTIPIYRYTDTISIYRYIGTISIYQRFQFTVTLQDFDLPLPWRDIQFTVMFPNFNLPPQCWNFR